MFTETIERDKARDLYLYSDKTQKEIAAEVDVSDRTIREWIKKFKWDEIKYRMQHPPLTLSEGIRLQLTNLQNNILSKFSGTPNADEVNIMHKLILCLYRLSTMPQFDAVISNPPSGERSVGQTDNSLACPPEFIPNKTSGEGARGGCNNIPSQLTNLPLSSQNFSSSKAEETLQILAPLCETEPLTQLPLSPKSGSKTEPGKGETEKNDVISSPPSGERSAKQTNNLLACPPLAGVGGGCNNIHFQFHESSNSANNKTEVENNGIISTASEPERSAEQTGNSLTEGRSADSENTNNPAPQAPLPPEPPLSVSAAIEEQQLKAKLKQEAEELEKATRQRENINRVKDSMRWEHENKKRNNYW